MKTYVISDIHGNYKGLMQCLERCNFDYQNDTLISLGDVVDRGPDTYECIEELLKIKNLIAVKGNHDSVFEKWLNTGKHELHFYHGAVNTFQSYINHIVKEEDEYDRFIKKNSSGWITNMTKLDIPESHYNFFKNQLHYYTDDDNNCFVHGGFNRHEYIEYQDPEILMWDRDLVLAALSYKQIKENDGYKFKMVDNFNTVFVGHTPTLNWKSTIPLTPANIVMLDTGGGYEYGKITIMDVNTKEYWQSDFGRELYTNFIK